MGVKWTEEQQKVIQLRNRNILVSAAAGSGKTAVLVERIISRITDEKHPVDVDHLLIVTYTDAAAREMKERIGAAIEKKLEERPGDLHLEQQATLVHSAPITTTHSFCLSVIRDHFHVIGIDPGFRIAEEGELRLLKQDVLEELLEQSYATGEEEFLEFVEKYGTGRNDRKIEGIILQMYEYSRSYPQPDRWLDECVEKYDLDMDHLDDAAILKESEARIRERLQGVRRFLELAMQKAEEPAGPYMYGEMLESDLVQFEKVEQAQNYLELEARIRAFEWKRLSAKKDDSVDPDLKETVKELRNTAKKLIGKIQEQYFYVSVEEMVRDMQDSVDVMQTLTGLVRQFTEMLDAKKRQRNMIDFSDMEQFALQILTEEKDGELLPSQVAKEYQEQFEEVMVDEYQDSNLVQETILTSVSRTGQGRKNRFMVGDVKQSIYRFRLSRPELFMEKYETYSLEESEQQRIDLHKNFRSRAEVLESANYFFRKIMRKEFGMIEYDDSAALYTGAEFPENEEFSNQTEILLYDKAELNGKDDRETEARMIARRMKEIRQSGRVLDKETGGYRPVQYRDMVVLIRSLQGWADTFSAVLAEEGIPAYSVSKSGYFETYEVSVLLDYLKLLDNARQDLPLTAVLTSPFANMNASELARIRLAYPNVPFYLAVEQYMQEPDEEEAEKEEIETGFRNVLENRVRELDFVAEDSDGTIENKTGAEKQQETEQKIRQKLQQFWKKTQEFRRRIPFTAIHDLLTEIIEETGYGTYISAMPGGAQRAANVEMLVEKAAAFEGTSYKGLFNFVRYIEQLKKYDVDYGEASIQDEQADTVRIMSIHKSKGLEFPIVFVAGMGKQFNMSDQRGSIVIHPELGVGIDTVDLELRTKAPTFLKSLIQEKTKLENMSEELRVLYVAMTRAKEKMILTGITDLEKWNMEDTAETVIEDEDRLDLTQLENAKCYFDWILPAWREDAPAEIRIFTDTELEFAENVTQQTEQLALDVLEHWDTSKSYLPSLGETLEEQMDYIYPYQEDGKMKLKFTVSELKKRAYLEEESGEEMYAEPEIVPLIPKFMQEEEEGLKGASRGSAYHKLLELLDFSKVYDEKLLKEVIDGFQKTGKLSQEMADCIRPRDILAFLQCESGRRMADAAKSGKLYKEQPFVLGVDADEIYQERKSKTKGQNPAETQETILVQGIIDVYFEEEDGLVLLDYKTDRVNSAEELKEKYHAQLDYYAQALEKLRDKPVKEKIIYSFGLRKEMTL